MSQTIQVPDNIPVSWLQQLRDLSKDVLMLASDPNTETETEYMSKYFTFGSMESTLSTDFRLGAIWTLIDELSSEKLASADCFDNTIRLDIDDPYIISSMRQDCRGIISVDGYRLSAGMASVFTKLGDKNQELTVIIPQLSARTTALQSPLTTYISSIIDKNGHIQSIGTARIDTAISANIPTSTVACPDGNYLTSVTTTAGVVTGVASKNFMQSLPPLSKVYYKDYSTAQYADDTFDQSDLYMMKLTYDQLVQLSSAGKIRKDCVYMTINDPQD